MKKLSCQVHLLNKDQYWNFVKLKYLKSKNKLAFEFIYILFKFTLKCYLTSIFFFYIYFLSYSIFFLFFCEGLDKIEFLQGHENREIYQKSFDIIERFFSTEEEDKVIAPQLDQNAQQYQFGMQENAPMGGFQFWADYF